MVLERPPKGAGRRVAGRVSTTDGCRRCVVAGAVMPRAALIRFVVSPEGVLVPDIGAELPGRGLWLSARRDIIEMAVAGKQVARAARRNVIVPDDLAGRVEGLLARHCLELIGLARRAGEAVAGFEKVREWLRSRPAGALLAASDGAADGRGRLRGLAPGLSVVDVRGAGRRMGARAGGSRGRWTRRAGHEATVRGGAARGVEAPCGPSRRCERTIPRGARVLEWVTGLR
jgi:hypothetical protein